MLTIYPDYYKHFTCIADTCPITCCQEWKIYVDDTTKKKWKALSAPDSMDADGRLLSSYITKKEGSHVIRLLPDHRCPFLTENKLCCLVQTYGDSVLSETCTLFPRELHTFSTHKEASLMPCCPAVIDLWQQADAMGFPSYTMLSQKVLSQSTGQTQAAFLLRDHLIRLFSDASLTPEEALLTAFYFLQELLREEKCPEERRELLESLQHQTSRLQFLMESMIKLSRMETGIIQISKEEADVTETIRQALTASVAPATRKQISLYMKQQQPVMVSHDRRWTAEAVGNLLKNAIKYTPAGGSISIGGQQQELFTVIAVSDTGKGIKKERQAEIYREKDCN